jgi:hypothetical protein
MHPYLEETTQGHIVSIAQCSARVALAINFEKVQFRAVRFARTKGFPLLSAY